MNDIKCGDKDLLELTQSVSFGDSDVFLLQERAMMMCVIGHSIEVLKYTVLLMQLYLYTHRRRNL